MDNLGLSTGPSTGLSTAQAKHWPCFLKAGEYNPGTNDGQVDTDSRKTAQKYSSSWHDHVGTKLLVDGIVATITRWARGDLPGPTSVGALPVL
ncbi:hypothetical protein ACH4C2_30645 [Streptomyces sp. NPDC018057]|uniref:hypothetical protein n=1 Tax=unclassified Streptomyces TaxID=2593676 RepID=UPI00378E379D